MKYNGRAILILPGFFIQACHFNENNLVGKFCRITNSGQIFNNSLKERIPAIIPIKEISIMSEVSEMPDMDSK
jgi:hypothetical protein